MTLRKRTKYSTNEGYQRVSLLNGTIPGRKAKPYHVSYYTFKSNPGRIMYRHVNTGWSPVLYDRSLVGSHVSRFPETQDFLFDPFGLPNADTIDAAATSKLHSKVQKARDTGFNAAVFLAELPSTMKMFANTATRLYKAQQALRRGDLLSLYRSLGVDYTGRVPNKDTVRHRAANYWLEAKYGWLPLLSDIDSAAHKVAHEVAQTPVSSVRAQASLEWSEYVELDNPPGKLSRHFELGSSQGLTFSVSNSMIAHAASLGFTNPMLIAWETVPLSFVFDWLIPFGDWLQQFSTFHGLEFVDGWSTRKGKLTEIYSYPSGSSRGTRTFSWYDDNGFLHRDQVPEWDEEYTASSITVVQSGFHRSPMSSFPGRTLPRLNFGASLSKLVTSLALIKQRR